MLENITDNCNFGVPYVLHITIRHVLVVGLGFLLSLSILGLDASSLKRTYDISSGGGIHPELDDPLPPQLQMRPGGVPPNAFRA